MRLLKDILNFLLDLFLRLAYFFFDWFIDLDLAEKGVFFTGFVAFLAVVMPSAQYYIFDDYFRVNNPLSVYIIGIALFMFATLFFNDFKVMLARVIINLYCLLWIIYYHFVNPFVKCEHEILAGYMLTYLTVILYIALSVYSYYRTAVK